MTNDRTLYILPFVNYNVYWPMASFFIRYYMLLCAKSFCDTLIQNFSNTCAKFPMVYILIPTFT